MDTRCTHRPTRRRRAASLADTLAWHLRRMWTRWRGLPWRSALR